MVNKNCNNCGKLNSNTFCTEFCKTEYEKLFNKSDVYPLYFHNLNQASEFFGKDSRTLKSKFENILFKLDPNLINKNGVTKTGKPRIKTSKCKTCNFTYSTSESRAGYCKDCTKAGLGKKEQGKIISKLYTGVNNPNYINGLTSTKERQKSYMRRWSKAIKKLDDKKCVICKSTESLESHHILPVSFFPELMNSLTNGITLCMFHHTELHLRLLDIELLPILYQQHIQDALNLRQFFLSLFQVQQLGQLPYKEYSKLDRLRKLPRNYRKLLQSAHPEFARQVLNL